jgi:tetratricopeptide (TPR) repeat protein
MSEHELWNELGNLYFLSGEYQQAVHAYRRSIQLDDGFGRPYSNLALTYVQQGKYDQAIDLYRRSIALLSDNKEKAISWNRLGNVFRHLKDYKQAVVAYRSADELDPETGEDEDKPGWVPEPDSRATPEVSRLDDMPLSIEDPFPYAFPAPGGETTPEVELESTATWAPIDPTLFQQDIFEALDPGTLTTWGDPNTETDDPDANWPPDAGTEVFFPDLDGDDLSKWIPVPEEQPLDTLEYTLEAVDLAAELEEAPEAPGDWHRLDIFSELKPEPPDPAPVALEAEHETKVLALLPPIIETRTAVEAVERGGVTITDVDVIVQERPTTEFVLAAEEEEESQAEPEAAVVEAEAQVDAVLSMEGAAETAPSEVTDEPLRDPEELREIEAGLAKYRRVVQVNPKNARAWDTLGNLHKSAGQYREALLAYQKAIDNDPSKALFHHHLGLVYACDGHIDDAIAAFQQVIELEPDHALAHATLGGYYRKKGLEELAQKHIGIAMKSIFDSENEYNRACLAAICGNTDQALELLRVALMNKQTYVDWILRDPDLDFIRQDPRFKQLVSDYAR